jgi:Tfp pilus assembly protein PilF
MSAPGGAQTVQGTDSAAAHALYVQARAALPDRDALHRLLDEAIAIDRDYAPAYALKAEHYAAAIAGTVARSNDLAAASELDRLAVHNAEKAIALDPSSSSAYSALALAHRQFWRWPQADAAYRRAALLCIQRSRARTAISACLKRMRATRRPRARRCATALRSIRKLRSATSISHSR